MYGYFLMGLLLVAILFIIYSTARLNLHPFLALLLTSIGVGLLSTITPVETVTAITEGFGNTLSSIGIVIAAGTIIGTMLEKSGGSKIIATRVVRWVGKARSALAMSFTGAIVSIPVYCDSGFVILSPLNKSLASQSRSSLATFAVALSMGLYTTHVFVPPTPGPLAAAGTLNADIGSVIILGLIVTIPVIFVTYFYALWIGKRINIDPSKVVINSSESMTTEVKNPPSFSTALLPILIPMLLIALGSVANLPGKPFGEGTLFQSIRFLGDPNTALILGVLLSFRTIRTQTPKKYGEWVGEGLKNAGAIILITGAGGAFGHVLRATNIGSYLGESLAGWSLGILLPFIVAAVLKTAQGSSTVAVITSSSIILPLLPGIGLAEGLGPTLGTLAIGAGAMTVSHANDSYFWVVSQFSGMDTSQAYRLQTAGSAIAGFTGIVIVFLLRLIII